MKSLEIVIWIWDFGQELFLEKLFENMVINRAGLVIRRPPPSSPSLSSSSSLPLILPPPRKHLTSN